MKTLLTHDVEHAAAVIRAGGLAAFPTETVYGLGADGLDPRAVSRIFAVKGRPADNPLILHVATPGDAERVAVVGSVAADLVDRFWPGPLTLVLPARGGVPSEVRAGLPTVAVRCPDHLVADALLRAVGRPVAAPSANRSGRVSPTTADAVMDDLGGQIEVILDAGPCRWGLESTVVDCSRAQPRILRLGALPAERLGLPPRADASGAGASPGTRHRHYAPAVPLLLVGDLGPALRAHPGAAVICRADEARALGLNPGPGVHVWGDDPAARAAELYAALRRLERSGSPVIIAAALPAAGLDAATMDRLERASAAAQEDFVPGLGTASDVPGRRWRCPDARSDGG